MTDLATTRRSLHGVAELLLAGPQHRESGTIRLAVPGDGFRTVAAPAVSVTDGLVTHGEESVAVGGRTAAELGRLLGLDPGPPEGLYSDGSGVALDEVLLVDAGHAADVVAALARGAAALRAFQPAEEPVLWPEHFDVGITVDEVNFGVSPGDGYLPEPYAYVGPWRDFSGPFWNAPFGAARPLRELPDLPGWFAEGAAVGAGL
jgi:hypothetical protein